MSILRAERTLRQPRPAGFAPALSRLIEVLWPQADVRLGSDRPPRGFRAAESFDLVPGAPSPEVLVPAWQPSLVGTVLRRYDDGMSLGRRLRRAMLAGGADAGLRRFPQLQVSLPCAPRAGELLTHVLREVLGRPDALVALSVGGSTATRGPTADVLTPDGEVLAYAKVGWNGSSDALLSAEVEVLRRWRTRRTRTFAVPRLLHAGTFRDHVLTVFEPLPTTRWPVRPPDAPQLDVLREVVSLGGVALSPLGSSPFWLGLADRALAGSSDVRRSALPVLEWMHGMCAGRVIWQGSRHGDWTARCMSTVERRVYVRDWELSEDHVPLGIDVLHFHFQAALGSGTDVRRAAELAHRRADASLRALGVPARDHPLVVACHVADRLLRLEDDRDAGADVDPEILRGLLGELRVWAGRS